MIVRGMIGQEQAVALLSRATASGRLPHALLFQGPPSVGKGTVALRLGQALLCEIAPPSSGEPACGACPSCLKIEHGNHPDLFVVERLPRRGTRGATADDADVEDEEAGSRGRDELRSFIVVNQIRDVAGRAAMGPREGRFRVFVIDPADRMNTEAQNALLKTLEEPPGRSHLILVASRPHLLLPTVRSRCLVVRFSSLPVADLARTLESRGVGRLEAMTRASLSGGRPGAALAIDIDALRGRRDDILALIESLTSSASAVAALPAGARALVGEGEDDLLEGLDLFESLLRDAGRCAVGSGDLVNADLEARLGPLGARLGATRSASLIGAAERTRRDLRFNVNRILAAEALLAALAGGPVPPQ